MKYFKILFPLFVILLFSIACEYNGPTNVWDPQEKGAPAPVITGIEPENEAFSGLTEIRISGENFSSNAADIAVYFGTSRAEIVSATTRELVVIPPKISHDSLQIRVILNSALAYAHYSPYRLKSASIEFASFGTLDVLALAVDKDDNVYASLSNKTVVKIKPDGEKIAYATLSFKPVDSRIGPDGNLFIQKNMNQTLYVVPPGGGEAIEYSKQPLRKKLLCLDFDQYQNIFTAGFQSGLFVLNEAKKYTRVGVYHTGVVNAVRVYNGYVYVVVDNNSVEPARGIWRSKILNETGELGENELVLDWANTGEYADNTVYDITFSFDGDMLIGTDNPDPILVLHPDGSMEPLYSTILIANAEKVVWGNGKYIYMQRGGELEGASIYRIEMTKDGAPYYGR